MSDYEMPSIEAVVQAANDIERKKKAEESGEESFTASITEFIDASPWLGPAHRPALVTLKAIARELDTRVTAAMIAQFGVAFRDLRAQAPEGPASQKGTVAGIVDKARS